MHMFGQLRPKPDARMLRRLAARLRVPATRCVLVEDTLVHQKSARSVGMKTVWMHRWTRAAAKPGARHGMRPAYVDLKLRHLRGLERRLQNRAAATTGAPA
jgi:putative hydrolase of the HAD superfamily